MAGGNGKGTTDFFSRKQRNSYGTYGNGETAERQRNGGNQALLCGRLLDAVLHSSV